MQEPRYFQVSFPRHPHVPLGVSPARIMYDPCMKFTVKPAQGVLVGRVGFLSNVHWRHSMALMCLSGMIYLNLARGASRFIDGIPERVCNYEPRFLAGLL